jgi:O-antigen ligase
MNKLILIKGSLEIKISYYLLAALLISLPFDRFYSQLFLSAFIVHSLIFINRQKLNRAFRLPVLMGGAMFIVTLIGLAYSPDRMQGTEDLLRQSPLLLFPFFLLLSQFPVYQYRRSFLQIFSFTCVIVIIWLFLNALYTIINFHLPFSALFSIAFINHNFSRPIEIHATYLSMYLGLSLVFFMECFLEVRNLKKRIFYGAAMIILLAGLFQLASRSVLIATIFIFVIAFPLFLPKGTVRLRFIAVSLTISLLALAGILTINSFKKRYVTELKNDLTNMSLNNEALEPRLKRWEFVMELIRHKPITGYGSGTERRLLKDIYFENKYYNSFLHGLNAHNQYLSIWLKTGIWGLGVLLVSFLYGLLSAWKRKDVLFASFMLFCCIVSFSENIFDVSKGIFFYAVFYSLFIFSKEKTTGNE